MSASFLQTQSVSLSEINYNDLFLKQGVNRHLLTEGRFSEGVLKDQDYEIVLLHPEDNLGAFTLSKKVVIDEQVRGTQNFKDRSYEEIGDNLTIDLVPNEEKGGLVVGLVLKDTKRLLAMGGVKQIVEENDGGRGINYDGCDLRSQTLMNMAATDPEFRGSNLIGMILPYRLKIAHQISVIAPHRTHLVAKVAKNTGTYNFYTDKKKIGLEEHASELQPNLQGEPTLLTTLVGEMRMIGNYLTKQHADIHARELDLYSLHDYHKTALFCTVSHNELAPMVA